MQVSRETALSIARADAAQAYRNLDAYEASIVLRDGNWLVDYELKDRNLQGGGPHYVISASTGEIVSKRYQQ